MPRFESLSVESCETLITSLFSSFSKVTFCGSSKTFSLALTDMMQHKNIRKMEMKNNLLLNFNIHHLLSKFKKNRNEK